MWFDAHQPELKAPTTASDRARMQEGIAVGKLAHGLFPEGQTARYVGHSDAEAAEATRQLIESGAPTLFEATFVTDDRVVRTDVLQKHPEAGWILHEVKSSTEPKPEHKQDVAFQAATLQKGGLDVKEANLILLNKAYVWPGGDHALDALFARVDLTAECEALREEVDREAAALVAKLALPEPPEVPLYPRCKDCGYAGHCLNGLAPDDLIYMTQAQRKHVDDWRAAGYRSIREIPLAAKRHAAQLPVIRMHAGGGRWISEGLAGALAAIEFPAAFIDFETCATALPSYVGTGPHEQVCFQWSAHLLASPGAEPEHREYLHPDATDPREEFCCTLWDAVQSARTLVVYSGFEKARVRRMTESGIPLAAELLAKLEAAVDLEKVVRENVCLEEFRYRTSIKNVLPALVPSMSYKDLAIGDGAAAMAAFRRMVDPATLPADSAQIREDLLTYCCQDTRAMVEVYRALLRLA